MELVVKLLLNSLYGKFAQSKRINTTITDLNTLSSKDRTNKLLFEEGEIKDNFHILLNEEEFNGCFTFPILSSYITSYARITLHEYLQKYNGVYCDTDSIVTKHSIPDSNELGKMKLEANLKKCEFVKPKFYYMQYEDDTQHVKMKGINKAKYEDFLIVKNGESVKRTKFSKIKESVRRGLKPNTIINIDKSLNLIDDKRIWDGENSSPIILNEE